MMFIKWFLLAIVSFAGKLLNYPLAPFVALFVKDDGYLPNWLGWFQTPDNPTDGDRGWKLVHWQWRFKLPSSLSRYVGHVGWLWRNSLYGFKIRVLGFEVKDGYVYSYKGNQKVSDKTYVPGWVYRTLVNPDGSKCFQFYAIISTTPTRCIRIMAGWKLWKNPLSKGYHKQLALVFTPFKKRGYNVYP